jgi:hypothetical protein
MFSPKTILKRKDFKPKIQVSEKVLLKMDNRQSIILDTDNQISPRSIENINNLSFQLAKVIMPTRKSEILPLHKNTPLARQLYKKSKLIRSPYQSLEQLDTVTEDVKR